MKYERAYTEGNTVRKLSQEPVRQPGRSYQDQFREVPQPKRGKTTEQHVGFFSMLLISVCAVAACVICVNFLQLQASNTRSMKQIAALEIQLTELRKQNNDEYNRLMSCVDLNAIRETAIEELGMVYACADQIILYDGHTNDYVRQYGEIPVEEPALLEGLLNIK